MKTLRMIFGDQLSPQISALEGLDPAHDLVFLCEVQEEATFVKHHKKKIALIFSAMRHFAKELKSLGMQVRYTTLDDPKNTGSFTQEVSRAVQEEHIEQIILTHPGEFRVLEMVKTWPSLFNVQVKIREDTRFLCSIDTFARWIQERKAPRMEYFYRLMRQTHRILIEDDKPVGGKWNYDQSNRKKAPSNLEIPPPYRVEPDTITRQVLTLVHTHFSDHFGSLEPFFFAVTRSEAQRAFEDFLHTRLPLFGVYQDAMLMEQPWMFHSHLSFYLNCGLLDPLECIRAAERAYYDGKAPLASVEGFIRQLLGWREYIRGIYWTQMPDYGRKNFFDAKQKLPSFYWSGNTEMECLRQSICQTQQHAYAHHIQRLMVLGNFALLIGVSPQELNEWFFIVYADAYEWVELPNVTGMALFADGGLLASKPYASSGAYIHKMSNYCQNCRYNVKEKTGPDACPFNYLYWNFLETQQHKLHDNPRIQMMYRILDKMDLQMRARMRQQSQQFIKDLT